MAAPTGYEQFVDDDERYLRWINDNPHGLVVNSHRLPVSSYLILHRASCASINTPERTNWTTTGYIKTCSTELAALVEWARRQAGGSLKPCGVCRPVLRPTPEWSSDSSEPVPKSPAAAVPEAQPPNTPSTPTGHTLPPEIATGCPELDLAWKTYASMILHRSHILIPDTDADLTWHAFLGHSIDMQGFRAAEFAGVDPLTRTAPAFVPLKTRGIGVPELAALWDVPAIQDHLLKRNDGVPLKVTLELLRSHGGAIGASLAEAFAYFPWRKFHWSVRALLQNSAILKPLGYSFRRWLQNACAGLGVAPFPPEDFQQPVRLAGTHMSLERALRLRLEHAFYMVGPAMSAYMLCDWQLWLWRAGKTAVFANFKLDSFHEAFVKKFGRGAIPASEIGFADWWLRLYPDLPPRLANECIWLAVENKLVNPW